MEDEGEIGGNDGSSGDGSDWRGSMDSAGDGVSGRRSVRLRRDKLPALAQEILSSAKEKATGATTTTTTICSNNGTSNGNDTHDADLPASSSTTASWIEWDSEGWHYNGDGFTGSASQKAERVALYLLALDAINFCFWPYPEGMVENFSEQQNKIKNNPLEYEHLAMALKGLAAADHKTNGYDHDSRGDGIDSYAFAPRNLAQMTPTKMKTLLQPYLDEATHPMPNIEKRSLLWKEVGEGLIRDYDGSATELLYRANNHAPTLVELVATSFPGFRDEAYLSPALGQDGRIVFLKRAQIFVGDINAALNLRLRGMAQLTTFADYRVPQILRHWEILEYAPILARKVDQQTELLAGSTEEISIRAATVVAVEELVKLLNESRDEIGRSAPINGDHSSCAMHSFTDVNVDWYLWQVGERMHQEGLMKPFHKVRTHFY